MFKNISIHRRKEIARSCIALLSVVPEEDKVYRDKLLGTVESILKFDRKSLCKRFYDITYYPNGLLKSNDTTVLAKPYEVEGLVPDPVKSKKITRSDMFYILTGTQYMYGSDYYICDALLMHTGNLKYSKFRGDTVEKYTKSVLDCSRIMLDAVNSDFEMFKKLYDIDNSAYYTVDLILEKLNDIIKRKAGEMKFIHNDRSVSMYTDTDLINYYEHRKKLFDLDPRGAPRNILKIENGINLDLSMFLNARTYSAPFDNSIGGRVHLTQKMVSDFIVASIYSMDKSLDNIRKMKEIGASAEYSLMNKVYKMRGIF